MFAERKKRRLLQHGIDQINDQLVNLRGSVEPADRELRSKLQTQLSSSKRKLDIFESKLLEAKAIQLGIEIPPKGGRRRTKPLRFQ